MWRMGNYGIANPPGIWGKELDTLTTIYALE